MHLGRDSGIFKIVGVLVSLVPQVEPGMGILVDKQRRERADVADALIVESDSFPRVPGFGGKRMCG